MESLSPPQARKLILLSQGLPPTGAKGSALAATLDAFERLGYIQIDTISAVQRAHHHTLWNRNPRYSHDHIDKLLETKQIFEYWSHAAAYLPMRDYRYSLVRKKALLESELSHWYDKDEKLMKTVLKRIENEGPLMSRDFEGERKFRGEWYYKSTKRALEHLFMEGKLMVPRRINFQKVYDLTERVLPPDIDTSLPSNEEYARYLIEGFLNANGIGKLEEMIYLRKKVKPFVNHALKDMLLNRELIELKIAGEKYYALPNTLELLDRPLSRNKLKILSPFDNLLIQRKRMQALFDFDYQIECYLPESKRIYGYFSLPILWDGRLVARMDCKADRTNGFLHVHHLVLEPALKKIDAFSHALNKELYLFMKFNDCDQVKFHKVTPTAAYDAISRSIQNTRYHHLDPSR